MNTGASPWLHDRDFHAAVARTQKIKLTPAQREKHVLLEEFKAGVITAKELAVAIRNLQNHEEKVEMIANASPED